jgi:antitoxin HicB
MLKAYPALFHCEDGGYWVEFPDLDGCFSQGDSIAEANSNAADALGGYLLSAMRRNIKLPDPSAVYDLSPQKPDFASVVVVDMDAYVKRTKAVKKTLTIPEWLNEAAEAKHINFSSVLQAALISQLQL